MNHLPPAHPLLGLSLSIALILGLVGVIAVCVWATWNDLRG